MIKLNNEYYNVEFWLERCLPIIGKIYYSNIDLPESFPSTIFCYNPGFNATVKINMDEQCTHYWKSYQGFTETYAYCEKCDLKK